MRPPPARSLLVEHPALPQPFDREDSGRSSVEISSLGRFDRIRVAVQLVSVTSMLADFELWPGRSVLRRATAEVSDRGLRVQLDALPLSLSRVWSGLGGGDPAAEGTRAAVLGAIAELTELEQDVFEHGGTEPGFFLDGVLSRLLGELDQPLDDATARSLWMWRWSLPPLPEIGDTSLFEVPDEAVSRRLGAAVWAAAVRSGEKAILEVTRPGADPSVVADGGGVPRFRVMAGTFDEKVLASVIDPTGDREFATIALGRFPSGWNPNPAPIFDAERLSHHLAVAGLSPARKVRLIDGLSGRFDIFSAADRRLLTCSAAVGFSRPRRRHGGRFRELVGMASLAPEGVPVSWVLDFSRSSEEELAAACDAHLLVRRQDVVMLPAPVAMAVDPRHAELVDLFAEDDPRRLLHDALASGNPGELLDWARERLDHLDAPIVRRVLSGIATGALGPGVQTALAEACLSLADMHGARQSLVGLAPEIARPWSNWLHLMDRHPEFEVEQPRRVDFHQAPRACAEIALVSLRRALRWDSESVDEPLDLIRRALEKLQGLSQRLVEIKLAALVEPHRFQDARWRRTVCGSHPELVGLVLFERSVLAMRQGQNRLARRLLRRVMSAERAPGRLALMQVNLGVLEARLGRHQASETLSLGAFRLFQTAGFHDRSWDALHNLAVSDIDRLRVDRAAGRLEAVARAEDSLFVRAELARLALAIGDLELFRSRLENLPDISEISTAQIVQALAFLYGVEALFFASPSAALPLLERGGDEAAVWSEFVRAILGIEDPATESGEEEEEDGWGVKRAAALAHAFRGTGPKLDLPAHTSDPLEPRDAFAVALCHRLGMRCASPLRLRALATLDEHGINGWADCLRWDGSEVEGLFRSLTEMSRNQGLNRVDDRVVGSILPPLGVQGLVVRSTLNGGELLRVGSGEPRPAERRGVLEITPLGPAPTSPAAWGLLGELMELAYSSGGADASFGETDVGIDGISPAAERLRTRVWQVAGPRFTVLIQGETGTGKEVVAREIHRLSGRTGEMISVNVAAVPANLLEAELFGSVKGAFTGAERSRRGLVAAAEGGSLFLDEVGDLDVALQVKLLRFLESGEVRAVGSDRTDLVDVRVICATHRNLERLVREGRFREDLFYRIGLVKVRVPALRERLEDILIFKGIFEGEASRRHGLKIAPWTAAAESRLMQHRWPGNVRELKHTVEAAMARAAGEAIRPEHLQLTQAASMPQGTWEGALNGFKKRLLGEVLTRHRGNRSAAARELGISRQALLYQIKKLGLKDL